MQHRRSLKRGLTAFAVAAASLVPLTVNPPAAQAATLGGTFGGIAKIKVSDGTGSWHFTVTQESDTGWTNPTTDPAADRPNSQDEVQVSDWCKLEYDAVGSPALTAPDYITFRLYVPGTKMTVGGTGFGGWDATPEFGVAEKDYIDQGFGGTPGIGHYRDERHGGEIRLDWDNNYGAFYGSEGQVAAPARASDVPRSDDDFNNETPPSAWVRPIPGDDIGKARFPCGIAGFPHSPDDQGGGSFGTAELYFELVGGSMNGANTRGGNAASGTTTYFPGYQQRIVEMSSTFRMDDERDMADEEGSMTFGDSVYARVDWSDQPIDGYLTEFIDERGPCDLDGTPEQDDGCPRDSIVGVDNPQLVGRMAPKVKLIAVEAAADTSTVYAEGFLEVGNDVSSTRGEAFLGFVDQGFPNANYDIVIEFADDPNYDDTNSDPSDNTPSYGAVSGNMGGDDVMLWRDCNGSCHASGSAAGWETGNNDASNNKRLVKRSADTTTGTNYAANGAFGGFPHIDDVGVQAPVGFRPDGGANEEFEELQEQIGVIPSGESSVAGRMAGAVRYFETDWVKSPSETDNVVKAAKQGKLIVWSVKNIVGGKHDTTRWADAAGDTPQIRGHIADAQALAVAWNLDKIVVTFHHEPHDNSTTFGCSTADPDKDCFGTATQYKSVYTALNAAQADMDGNAGNGLQVADRVAIAYVGVASNMDDGSPIGASDAHRPASTDYDVIATDPYNWHCYKVNTSPCSSDDNELPANHLASSLALAVQYAKPLIIAETASHPGCYGTNPGVNSCPNSYTSTDDLVDWIDALATWIETNADAQRYLVAVTHFHSLHLHDWRFFPIHEDGNPTQILKDGAPAGQAAAITEWVAEFGAYPQTGVDFDFTP